MNKRVLYSIQNNTKGFTLLEVLISLAVLSVIFISLYPLFVHTGIIIRRAETVIDATYVAQHTMEKIYNESVDSSKPVPSDGIREYEDEFEGKYIIVEETSAQDNLVRVLIRVYGSGEKISPEAQMESYFIWKYN